MGKKIKLEHYVPRFYLRNFSIQGKEGFLYCFDKSKSHSFIVNVKNIASETYFYDTRQDVEQKTEKGLGQLEALFEAVITKLISSEDLAALTSKQRLLMSYFVVTQELRTREHRAMLEDMHKQTLAELSKRGVPKESLEKVELTKEQIKSWHISELSDVPDYANIVNTMKWILFVNRTSMPFWCSDHPVNRFNYIDARPYGNLGLLCRGIEIHCSLSPTISVSVCDPTAYYSLPNKYEIQDIRNTEFLNWLQVYYSTRYVFSDKDDFSLVQKILEENPSLGDIDRKRISVD
jgi:hypothetical protein